MSRICTATTACCVGGRRWHLASLPFLALFAGALSGAEPMQVRADRIGGTFQDQGSDMAVDQVGNVYLVGTSSSKDFPVTKAAQAKNGGSSDAFVMRLDPQGNVAFATYLGGTGYDEAKAVALDQAGNCWVVGSASPGFPTTSDAMDRTVAGATDGFLACFSPQGELRYSTVFGGAGDRDAPADIGIDASGTVIVVGNTDSNDYPLANPISRANGGSYTGFITWFAADGKNMNASTYFGGSKDCSVSCLAVRGDDVYVAGYTYSSDLPVVNAFQPTMAGPNGKFTAVDAFVAQIRDGTIRFASYLGGRGDDGQNSGTGNLHALTGLERPRAICVEDDGTLYVTGDLEAKDFPVVHALRSTMALASHHATDSRTDIFVTRIDPDHTIGYSTYFGGDYGGEVPLAMMVNGRRQVTVTGWTNQSSHTDVNPDTFPVVDPLKAQITGYRDVFVFTLDTTRQGMDALRYCSYLGGYSQGYGEQGVALARDQLGQLLVFGTTDASEVFLTRSGYGSGGENDAFLARFSGLLVDAPTQPRPRRDIRIGIQGTAASWSITPADATPVVEGASHRFSGLDSGRPYVLRIVPQGKS